MQWKRTEEFFQIHRRPSQTKRSFVEKSKKIGVYFELQLSKNNHYGTLDCTWLIKMNQFQLQVHFFLFWRVEFEKKNISHSSNFFMYLFRFSNFTTKIIIFQLFSLHVKNTHSNYNSLVTNVVWWINVTYMYSTPSCFDCIDMQLTNPLYKICLCLLFSKC